MKKQNALSFAREYIRRGFAVIPLMPKSKKPALASWREFQGRGPTAEELEAWFGNGSRNNIGIVTGRIFGLAVVDFDTTEPPRPFSSQRTTSFLQPLWSRPEKVSTLTIATEDEPELFRTDTVGMMCSPRAWG